MIKPSEAASTAEMVQSQIIKAKFRPLQEHVEKLIRKAAEGGEFHVALVVEDMEIPLYGKMYNWLKDLGYRLQGYKGKVVISWSRTG